MANAIRTLRVGDFGTAFRATVVDEDGAAVSITGKTITFRFAAPDGTTDDVAATIVNGDAGICQYILASGLLDQAGPWRWQSCIVDGVTSTFRTEIRNFTVTANL